MRLNVAPEKTSFRSFSQNQEDVVLWRALRDVKKGHYIEAGANYPSRKSVSYAFYLRGWTGVLIEPLEEMCDLIEDVRPQDILVPVAVSDVPRENAPFFVPTRNTRATLNKRIATAYGPNVSVRRVRIETLDSILESYDWARDQCHFLVLDVEGSEQDALNGLDLKRFRPWIIVVECIDPISHLDTSSQWHTILETASYRYSFSDGVSRFYVAEEHRDLSPRLYPACSTDDYYTDFPLIPQIDRSLSQADNRLVSDILKDIEKSGVTVEDIVAACIDAVDHEGVLRYINSSTEPELDVIEDLDRLLLVLASRARERF